VLNKKRTELAEIETRYGVIDRSLIDESFEGARMSVRAAVRALRRRRGPSREPAIVDDDEDDFLEDVEDEEVEDEEAEADRAPREDGDRNIRRRRRRRRGGRGRRRDGEGEPRPRAETTKLLPEPTMHPMPSRSRRGKPRETKKPKSRRGTPRRPWARTSRRRRRGSDGGRRRGRQLADGRNSDCR
jgi:ribonuclease E